MDCVKFVVAASRLAWASSPTVPAAGRQLRPPSDDTRRQALIALVRISLSRNARAVSSGHRITVEVALTAGTKSAEKISAAQAHSCQLLSPLPA